MNPNETLRELRDALNLKPAPSTSRFLAEQFAALDKWLTNGGALPDDWAKNIGITTGRRAIPNQPKR